MLENGSVSNGVQFTLLEALSVTGASPSSGMVGSTVTITGTGFGPTQSDSVATFDGVPATVTNWTDTSITDCGTGRRVHRSGHRRGSQLARRWAQRLRLPARC